MLQWNALKRQDLIRCVPTLAAPWQAGREESHPSKDTCTALLFAATGDFVPGAGRRDVHAPRQLLPAPAGRAGCPRIHCAGAARHALLAGRWRGSSPGSGRIRSAAPAVCVSIGLTSS
jgi:hypothetical protein